MIKNVNTKRHRKYPKNRTNFKKTLFQINEYFFKMVQSYLKKYPTNKYVYKHFKNKIKIIILLILIVLLRIFFFLKKLKLIIMDYHFNKK